MVEITYQMVLSTLQTTGLLVGIFYYIMTLQNTKKNQQIQLETRQAQIIMQAYQKFTDQDFIECYWEVMTREWSTVEEYFEKYPSRTNFNIITNFFEGIGVLLKSGLVDRALVYGFSDIVVTNLWERYKPIILWGREVNNLPIYLRALEYLADEMNKERILQGDPSIIADEVFESLKRYKHQVQ